MRTLISCIKIICLLLFIPFVFTINPIISPFPQAAQKKSYLSQELIDTTVLRAFYIINEATNVAGVGFRQKEAIEHARRIAQQLRTMAKGDPNERYVLWKVGELEAQLYLEEKDLLLQQIQKGTVSVNQLIARYNAEVGKDRPDFATMRKIHIQMGKLDNTKANELADSFNKRYRNISREVVFSLEKALMNGDLEKSRQEISYILRNRTYLTISDSRYLQLESRVEGLSRARELEKIIDKDLASAIVYLVRNSLNEARDKITYSKNNFSEIYSFLPQQESSYWQMRIDKTDRLLTSKEDSLVNINMMLLNNRGVKEANNYLQSILKPYGVSRDRVAMVDQAILGVNTSDDGKMRKEIGTVATEDDTTSNMVFDDIMSSAKKKAQLKADSIKAVQEKEFQKLQAEKAKQDSIQLAAQEKAAQKLRNQQEKAAAIAMEIYSKLEKNNYKAASNQFNKENSFLSTYLSKDAFDMLDATLNQSASESSGTSSGAIAYVSAVSEPESVPVSNQLKSNQQRAQEEIIKIYSMLEQNNPEEAYNRFQKIRTPLKKYLEKEIFDMLEASVLQAYNFSKSDR
jgi:hypothetical protein